MRTVLSRFSEDFVRSVRPLLDPLEGAAEAFANATESVPGRDALPDLRELRHQLEVLVNKVDDQNAFVLIFGPLKSGKSTLMNALSAAYVSEVSSLPAYPCMVYVSHAEEKSFLVTRYNGDTDVIERTEDVKAYVELAHDELVKALHRVENAGDEFDPAVHYPEAIRRIDVRVPAKALERSGAVLVDTPGLYSRMKFGYDRMTRDFRDAAASAIFVVKSDNLFLEQVFNEFNELLDLFSRIFLIVNVDSGKRDLGPAGDLVPSLEQEQPEKIVEAFKSYAMSAPLKRAYEEGRLKLYPIDLLRSASARLRGERGGLDAVEPSGETPEDTFSTFAADLAQFLNSTDYMVAFIQDSLRRSDTLLSEASEVLERDDVRAIGNELEELWQRKVAADRRREAVETLSAFGWESAFDDFEQKLAGQVKDRVHVSSDQTADALDDALDAWFQSDASVQSLIDDEIKPLLAEHHQGLAGFLQDTLGREASGPAGGIQVAPELSAELERAEIRADQLARQTLRTIRSSIPAAPLDKPLTISDVPVKKRIRDWMFLRRKSSVQRRLFGPDSNPTLRIPRAEKEARLGREGKLAMKKAIDRYKNEFFPAARDSVREHVLWQYSVSMSKALRKKLEERGATVGEELGGLDGRVRELGVVHDKLDRLRAAIQEARGATAELGTNRNVELTPQPRTSLDSASTTPTAEAAPPVERQES